MTHTEDAIQNLADAMCKGRCPREIYVESLQSLVRLAISEHVAAPILAAQADIDRVAEIRVASRSGL